MTIDTLEAVQLGDTTQWIRIRGEDTANPVLLLVQQGPGLPMINEVRRFERLLGLEKSSPSSIGTNAVAVARCGATLTSPST